jgi:purine nucleosidase
MSEPRRSLIVDTDGGTDDAVALWWALTDPRVELAAVLVTWGNVDRATAADNVCRILHAAGRPDIPVALGAESPIGPTPLSELAHFVHGDDGLGGYGYRWVTGDSHPVAEPAEELLNRLTLERPGELDLVTIGPLSTVARALAIDAALPSRLRSLTVMGGAVRRPGNSLPVGEANIAHDPEASSAVVTASGYLEPPLLVGLDVTLLAPLHEEDLVLAAEDRTPAARFLADPLRAYADFYGRSKQLVVGACACHDLLATVVVVEPDIVGDAPIVPLAVDTGGSAAWGATIADFREREQFTPPGFAPWRVALQVDADRFRQLFRSMVF